jgi:hypothetical protein
MGEADICCSIEAVYRRRKFKTETEIQTLVDTEERNDRRK